MSELKAYRFLGIDEIWTDAAMGSLYYLKSEADKEISRQKYKRCLAMAKRYEFESRYYDLLTKVEASYLLSNPHNVHKYERKSFRSKVLCIRFRELAEKFKEAK